ncbi:MAG: TauD/TfdA family dioxygenase [Sphingobium sp.]
MTHNPDPATIDDNAVLAAEAARRARDGARIVDLRQEANRHRDGAVPNAVALLPDALPRALAEGGALAGEAELLLLCDTGQLSAELWGALPEKDRTGIRIVRGGFAGWIGAELPIVLAAGSYAPGRAAVSPASVIEHPRIVVAPTSGHTGAEIHGVDLRQPLAEDEVAVIRQALLKWKVVFFREQFLTPAQLVQAGRHFGEVMKARSPMQVYSVQDQPEILVVGKAEYPGRGVDSPWHADLTFLPAPPMGALLQAIDVPPFGGDTSFTNLVAAYDDLSAPIRGLIDGLWAVHHDRFRADGMKTVHPVVRVHPETGEKLIWVNPNYTDHILGLTAKESGTLLTFLYEHMTRQAYTTRFRWHPGSIAFWDNRASAHSAPTDLSYAEVERILHRITIAGDVPLGTDGTHSRPFEPAA